MDNIPDSLFRSLTNDENANRCLTELSSVADEIEGLEKQLTNLKKKRERLVVKAYAYDAYKNTIASVARLNRNTVAKILEQDLYRSSRDNAFVNDASVPKEQSPFYRQEHSPEEIAEVSEKYKRDLAEEQARNQA